MLFNTLNAYMQGGWLFYVSPVDYYSADWLTSLPFLAGTALFLFGMGVNIHSDRIIRNLRKPGDTAHYLPRGGMFRWVTSANYFGELVEWTGFAILTWSVSGAVFALWTFANLAPRAARAAGYPYHQTHHSLYFLNVSYRLSYFYAGANWPRDAQEPHYPLGGV